VEEIVQGIMGCLDEVGNEKIGKPMEAKTTDDLESRYSFTTATDLKNNLMSAQNAYLGAVPDAGTQGSSLSAWVAQKDAQLDTQIKQELQTAIAAISAIPTPVEPKITDGEALAKLKSAQDAILTVHKTFDQNILPLVQKS
jgi:uncharacterized iron-regulated protein